MKIQIRPYLGPFFVGMAATVIGGWVVYYTTTSQVVKSSLRAEVQRLDITLPHGLVKEVEAMQSSQRSLDSYVDLLADRADDDSSRSSDIITSVLDPLRLVVKVNEPKATSAEEELRIAASTSKSELSRIAEAADSHVKRLRDPERSAKNLWRGGVRGMWMIPVEKKSGQSHRLKYL